MICSFDGLRWILWKIASIPLNYLISEETLFDILRLGISGVRGKHSVRVRSLHSRRLDYLNDIKLCFGRVSTSFSVAVP